MDRSLIVLHINEKCIKGKINALVHLWHNMTVSNSHFDLQLVNVKLSNKICDPYFMGDDQHMTRHHN